VTINTETIGRRTAQARAMPDQIGQRLEQPLDQHVIQRLERLPHTKSTFTGK
jgi:hypothetical protein